MESSRTKQKIGLTDKIFLSIFGIGYIPFIPGTWGSLATIPIIYFIYPHFSPLILILVSTLLTLASGIYLQIVAKKYSLLDPGWVVIDEFVALLLAASFFPHYDWKGILGLFVTFRIFDIIKIWPASTIDLKLKNGWGILLDDLVAAAQSLALLYLIRKLFAFYA